MTPEKKWNQAQLDAVGEAMSAVIEEDHREAQRALLKLTVDQLNDMKRHGKTLHQLAHMVWTRKRRGFVPKSENLPGHVRRVG